MIILKRLTQKIILYPFLFLLKEVKGLENLPKKGGYIVASNHASNLDPFILTSIVLKYRENIIRYIGKREELENVLGRFVYRLYNVIPLNRDEKSELLNVEVEKTLKSGGIIGIFPEGSRTFDGNMQKAKTGAAKFTIQNQAPIVPIAIKNTFNLWPRNKKYPRLRRKVKVNIGKPLQLSAKAIKNPSKKLLKDKTKILMRKIFDLFFELD